MKRNRLWQSFRLLLVFYIIGGIVLYFLQDLIIFHPKALPEKYSFKFKQPFKELNIKPGNGRNLNIVQFFPKEKAKGVVLYFHGNMTNIERYARYAPMFTKNNYEVWMIDYPGYGKTTGKRTEQMMYDDGILFYELATKQTPAENIFLYGKSLGTGVASYVASNKPCKQLILETPYYSMTSMSRHYVPIYPQALMKYSFPINEYLQKVNVPVTIFHGTADEIIPYKQSSKLKKELPHVDLFTVPRGTHNNLYRFPGVIQKIDSLLAG